MYIPLYNKTNYTLLSSLLKIDDLLLYAQNNNINSISITDTNMYGVQEFIKKCNSKNIKPIIGLTLITDSFNIVYLAKNYDGYKCLLKLSTIQNERKVVLEDLLKYSNDVICILPYEYKNSYKNNFETIFIDNNKFIYLFYDYSNEGMSCFSILSDFS